MTSEIKLTIDGKEIVTQPDKTILQAAIASGIYIPYLCYYPGMKPYGACRMCVVEVENGRGTPASCTTPIADGMVVSTDTQQIQNLRKGITELIISEHPHGCLTCHRTDIDGANLCGPEDICLRHVSVTDRCVSCPKNERCELKDTTIYVGTGLTTPMTYKYRNLPVLTQDPFYDLDLNLCIVCGRCVRACEELRGDSAITLTERSGISLVGPAYGLSLLESGCEFCGSCIDVCPVGALVESDYKWDKSIDSTSTTCPHCPVGCQLKLEVNKRGKVIRVIPELEASANRGQACFKGKFGLDFVNNRSRLKTPLIKEDGVFRESTWEEAISVVAEKLSEYKRNGQFAALSSHNNTNEEAYLLQKFTRSVMATNNVDHSSNIKPEIAEYLGITLGYRAATGQIWDVEKSDCIITVASNITEDHNVVAVAVKQAIAKGSRLVVVDSREVELTRYSDVWLKPRPGTDPIVLGAMLRVIIEESLENQEFLIANVDNLDNFKHSLWQFDLKKVEDLTGVSENDVRAAARIVGKASSCSILYALDNLNADQQTAAVKALVGLALITGNIGNEAGGIYPLRPGTNDQGSWDMGCVPHFLPGYRTIDDDSTDEIAKLWRSDVPRNNGLGVLEVFPSIIRGDVKAMLIIGDSPNFSNGELGEVVNCVKNLDFLVVQDCFLTEIGKQADVILPSVTFAEKEGTLTSLERRIQPLKKALEVSNSLAMPDWWIISEIAKAMGFSTFDYHCPAQVLNEISNIIPFYAGIKYERLVSSEELSQPVGLSRFPVPSQLIPTPGGQNNGIQWPCFSAADEGLPTLYSNFQEQDKLFVEPLHVAKSQASTNKEFPFLFIPGRVLHESRELSIDLVDNKNEIRRDAILNVNPEDAKRFGLEDSAVVQLDSLSAQLMFKTRISNDVLEGTVSSTSLFGELITDLEKSDKPNPMANVPGLKIEPVNITKYSP